ncbi:MAG: pentapeptide repeat-containing protein [Deltaproteobacteria bacterium]|nr:pentapeptide repeat-containing protein [Deltaproteobacteria bacterium]
MTSGREPVDLLARWRTPPWSELREALLSRPSRSRVVTTDLRGIELRGVDLSGLHLPGARLDFARLDRCNLDRAVLTQASFAWSSVVEATLAHASLRGATVTGANFSGADLHEADLSDASIVDSVFAGADMRAVNARGATLSSNDLGGAWTWGIARDALEGAGEEARRHSLGFPTLARLLAGRTYMALMSLRDAVAAREVEGWSWGSLDLDAEVVAALGQQNWRATLVGCAAACLAVDRIRSRDAVIDTAWSTLRRGSWASPQLAGTCFLLDARYRERAEALLAELEASGADTKRRAALAVFVERHVDDVDRGDVIAQRWVAHVREHAGAAARSFFVSPPA